jgi:RimJ/RimL family protein N-acetyltransferase
MNPGERAPLKLLIRCFVVVRCRDRMAGVITFSTPRLMLRRWREDDVAPMSAINADPQVMRWIGDGSIRDQRQTKAGIVACEREWDRHGFGLFALELRATGELIGFTGLAVPEFLPEVMPAMEIGWRLGRPFWGQGLATEAARAALRFGLIDRGLARIVSIAQVGNDASERIMGKLGMRLERETVDPTCNRPVRVHAITKAGYLSPGQGGHLRASTGH